MASEEKSATAGASGDSGRALVHRYLAARILYGAEWGIFAVYRIM
jgi:hypothetical protein